MKMRHLASTGDLAFEGVPIPSTVRAYDEDEDEDENLRAAACGSQPDARALEYGDDQGASFDLSEGSDRDLEDSELEDSFQPFEEEDSSDEWRPSEASDAALSDGDEEFTNSRQRNRFDGFVSSQMNKNTPSESYARAPQVPEGGSVGLSKAQLEKLGFDSTGGEGLRDSARQRRRADMSRPQGEEGPGIETEELSRLMAGISGTSALATMDLDDLGSTRELPRDDDIDNDGFSNDLEGISSFKKPQKRTRRAMQEQALSIEVQTLLSEANIAYVNDKPDIGIEKLREVIRIEPTVRSAWSTLALCFKEQKDKAKELQARIVEASLTPRAIDLWIDIAHESIEAGDNGQAIYCFDQAVKASQAKDKSDVLDAMWDRALLLREMGESRKAIIAFNHLLRVRPHNHDVLSELIPLLVSVQRQNQAIKLLQQSRTFNQKHFPNPVTQHGQRYATYRSSEIVTLADLLLQAGQPMSALHTLRQDARWLQGRAAETFWDQVIEDDREFDESRDESRTDAPRYGRRVDLAPAYGTLDPQIRLRLGCARANLREMDEAEHHFEEFFRQTDPASDFDDWMHITNLYMDDRRFETALNHLEYMTTYDFLESPSLYVKVGICNQALNHLDAARQCFDAVLQSNPSDLDVKMRLAEVYEEQGNREEALRLVKEVIVSRETHNVEDVSEFDRTALSSRNALWRLENPDATPPPGYEQSGEQPRSQSLYAKRKKSALRTEEVERLEQARDDEVGRAFRRLQSLEADVFVPGFWRTDVVLGGALACGPLGAERYHGMDPGVPQDERERRWAATKTWLEEATRLVESFLSASYLFPKDSKSKASKRRGSRQKQNLSGRRQVGIYADASQRANLLMARIQDNMLEETIDVGQDDRRSYASNSGKRAFTLNRFRGLDFDTWAELIMKCCFILTKVGDYSHAVEILNEAVGASVFGRPNEHQRIALRLCMVACALYKQDYLKLAEAVRYFFYCWQFNNTPIRLHTLLANAAGFYGLDLFGERRLSKMIVRRNRTQDAIIAGHSWIWSRHQRRYVIQGKLQRSRSERRRDFRWKTSRDDENDAYGVEDADLMKSPGHGKDGIADVESGDESSEEDEPDDADLEQDRTSMGMPASDLDEDETVVGQDTTSGPEIGERGVEKIVKRLNPLTELHYSFLLLVGSSYQAALSYSLRAYVRLPLDPLICLVAASACLGRMTNRQVDNRHHLLLQGLSFLSLYRRFRQARPLDTRSTQTQRGSKRPLGEHENGGDVTTSAKSGTDVATNNRPANSTSAGLEEMHVIQASTSSMYASMEAAYNLGRAYHSVGLFHLAVPQYEAALRAHDGIVAAAAEISQVQIAGGDGPTSCFSRTAGFDPYREAAYNLSVIFSINGNAKMARRLMDKYLRVQ